jgi:hypothetical protein
MDTSDFERSVLGAQVGVRGVTGIESWEVEAGEKGCHF